MHEELLVFDVTPENLIPASRAVISSVRDGFGELMVKVAYNETLLRQEPENPRRPPLRREGSERYGVSLDGYLDNLKRSSELASGRIPVVLSNSAQVYFYRGISYSALASTTGHEDIDCYRSLVARLNNDKFFCSLENWYPGLKISREESVDGMHRVEKELLARMPERRARFYVAGFHQNEMMGIISSMDPPAQTEVPVDAKGKHWKGIIRLDNVHGEEAKFRDEKAGVAEALRNSGLGIYVVTDTAAIADRWLGDELNGFLHNTPDF